MNAEPPAAVAAGWLSWGSRHHGASSGLGADRSFLETNDHRPLHERIYQHVQALILSGTLPHGAKLLSSRALAKALSVSRNSVATALDRLAADGWVEARRGAGVFVAYEGAQVGDFDSIAVEGPSVAVPFDLEAAPSDLFPVGTWNRIQSRHWRDSRAFAFADTNGAGSGALRTAIARHLAAARGIECAPSQVFVTSSLRMAIDLSIKALELSGTAGWVEDPGPYIPAASLEFSGVKTIPVPVDEEGLSVETGARRAPNARFALVRPACQFPTCEVMPDSRREALVRWATSNGGWIFEDDTGWQSQSETSAPAPIAARHPEHAIFLASFDQVLFPALQTAFVVAPRSAATDFARAANALRTAPANIGQMVLAEFLDGGHFRAHLQTIRRAYEQRRRAFRRILERDLGHALVPREARAGAHMVCRLTHMAEDAFLARCKDEGIEAGAFGRFRSTPSPVSLALLGFAGFSIPILEHVAQKLKDALAG